MFGVSIKRNRQRCSVKVFGAAEIVMQTMCPIEQVNLIPAMEEIPPIHDKE